MCSASCSLLSIHVFWKRIHDISFGLNWIIICILFGQWSSEINFCEWQIIKRGHEAVNEYLPTFELRKFCNNQKYQLVGILKLMIVKISILLFFSGWHKVFILPIPDLSELQCYDFSNDFNLLTISIVRLLHSFNVSAFSKFALFWLLLIPDCIDYRLIVQFCHGRPPWYVILSCFFSSHHAHIPESYILESFPCNLDRPVFLFLSFLLFPPGIYVQRVCVFRREEFSFHSSGCSRSIIEIHIFPSQVLIDWLSLILEIPTILSFWIFHNFNA